MHHFSHHKSYNTFLFAQVSPFKVKRNMFHFQISKTKTLNIGLYGKNQGGEHLQKKVKERRMKWTNKKPNWMVSLVNQTVEVYLGGLYMFPDLVPPAVDLYKENTTLYDIRFGILNIDNSGDCSTC